MRRIFQLAFENHFWQHRVDQMVGKKWLFDLLDIGIKKNVLFVHFTDTKTNTSDEKKLNEDLDTH